MEQYNLNQLPPQDEEEISIVKIFFHYLHYWKGFMLSVAVCLGLAYVYLLYATPQYKIVSQIMISDEKKGKTSVDMMTAFNDLGIIAPKNNADNEIEVLRSKTLMKGVVDSLRIGVSYFKEKTIRKVEIYKETPVFVSIPNVMAVGSFTVDKVDENTLSIYSSKENFNQKVEIGKELNSPWGILTFSHNIFGSESFPIKIVINNTQSLPIVQINSINKTSSVVELSIVTPTPQKGQDIINTLVAHYNKNAIDDKNYIAYNTIDFIDDRLKSVSGELQTAEKNVEDYQKTQGFTDLQTHGQLLMASSSEYSKRILDAEIQSELLKNIKNHLLNPAHKRNAVPSNVGLTDPTVISLINTYNKEVLAQKEATVGATENHPLLIESDNKIALIRDDLLKGITISETGMQSIIRELQRQENMYASKSRNLSTQQRETHDLYRQQTVKETLFTYLLQKREDTELSLVMATPNAKVIDPAFFNQTPIQPKKMIIFLAAFILGIIIPTATIYILDLFDNKIYTKDDVIRTVKAPFLGSIPIMKGDKVFPVIKVRSALAEHFRTIMSNLEFTVGNERRRTIGVTSSTSGEGKSFFARNLALSLASLGKKTLLIDLDMRKSTMAKTLEVKIDKGCTLFLSDKRILLHEIIDTSHTFHKNLDIIPVSIFPPNPAELLASERLGMLFQSIGKEYDYVIVDMAPVGLVADAYLINPYITANIFVLRSDYTIKQSLVEAQELYQKKKLNNLNVVLNAVSSENLYGYGRYGHYKHDYYTEEG